MAFDDNDTLYLHNSGGNIYTINTSTGLATFIASSVARAHHGDFNSDDDLYYGLGSFGPSGTIYALNHGSGSTLQDTITLDRSDVFTLAFANPSTSTVPEPATLGLLGLGLLGLGAVRLRKA